MRYSHYEESLRILKPGGWMAIDNVLWDGEVVNPDNDDPEVTAIKRFNEKVRKDTRVEPFVVGGTNPTRSAKNATLAAL